MPHSNSKRSLKRSLAQSNRALQTQAAEDYESGCGIFCGKDRKWYKVRGTELARNHARGKVELYETIKGCDFQVRQLYERTFHEISRLPNLSNGSNPIRWWKQEAIEDITISDILPKFITQQMTEEGNNIVGAHCRMICEMTERQLKSLCSFKIVWRTMKEEECIDKIGHWIRDHYKTISEEQSETVVKRRKLKHCPAALAHKVEADSGRIRSFEDSEQELEAVEPQRQEKEQRRLKACQVVSPCRENDSSAFPEPIRMTEAALQQSYQSVPRKLSFDVVAPEHEQWLTSSVASFADFPTVSVPCETQLEDKLNDGTVNPTKEGDSYGSFETNVFASQMVRSLSDVDIRSQADNVDDLDIKQVFNEWREY